MLPAWSKNFLIICTALYIAFVPCISFGQDQPPPRHKHSLKEMVTKIKKLNPFKKTKDDNAARKVKKPAKPAVDSKGRATQPII